MDAVLDLYALTDGGPAKSTQELIGGKALSLIRLAELGLSVPPASVLPVSYCAAYYRAGKVLDDDVRTSVIAAIRRLEQFTGKSLGPDPPQLQLAIRSGAAVSMPGLLTTVLSCGTLDEVLRGVADVFDSWNQPPASNYRRQQGLEHLRGTAVILQVMQTTRCAGVMFSQLPMSSSGSDTILIEAVTGLGVQIVSGEACDARWKVSRSNWHIDSVLQNVCQDLLTEHQVIELARIGIQIEQAFGFPVDIEWGLSESGWTFFQARRIEQPAARSERDFLAEQQVQLSVLKGQGHTCWVRHSLTEQVPFPTPFSWSVIQRLMSGSGGYGQLYRELGFAPGNRICAKGFVELIGGQIYASVSHLPDLYCDDFPFGFDERALDAQPARIDQPPDKLDLDRVGPWFLLKLPWLAWVLWRSARRIHRLRESAEANYLQIDHPSFQSWLSDQRQQQVTQMGHAELAQLLRRQVNELFGEHFPRLMLPGTIGAAEFDQLRRRLEQIDGRDSGKVISRLLLSKVSIPFLDQLHAALIELRQGSLSEFEFVSQYGHRSEHGLEFSDPRWCEDVSRIPVLSAQQQEAGNGTSVHELLLEFLRRQGTESQFNQLRAMLNVACRLLPYREVAKDAVLQGCAVIRETANALAKTTGLGDSLYFLTIEEVIDCLPANAEAVIDQRRQEWLWWQSVPLPTVIHGDELSLDHQENRHSSGVFAGTPVSAGIAQGILISAARFLENRPVSGPAIVVCDVLSTGLLTHMENLKGIVVARAALLSHGAVLARHFGIPVVEIPNAPMKLRQGTKVIIDGTRGTVRV